MMLIKNFFFATCLGLFYSSFLPLAFKDWQLQPFPFASAISIFGLLYFLRRKLLLTGKSSYLFLAFFQFGIGLLGLYWIPYTIKEFGGLNWFFSVLTAIPFFFICYPHFFLLPLCLKVSARLKSPGHQALIFATLATCSEWLPFTLFPAPAGSNALVFLPYLAPATHIGLSGFSFLYYLIAFSLEDFFSTKKWSPCVVAFITFFALWAALFPLKNLDSSIDLKVRLVQSNIGHAEKIDAELGFYQARDFIKAKFYQLSQSHNLDLIIWPETAFPEPTHPEDIAFHWEIDSLVTQYAPVLFGGYGLDASKHPSEHNSLFLKTKNSVQFYHKVKLLPFGETLPFGPLNDLIFPLVPEVSQFARGEKLTQMELKVQKDEQLHAVQIMPLICYEVLFPHFFYRFYKNHQKKAQLIVNVTNDSWYGPTNEPYQHLWLSRWRAIEAQVPMIRSTNTGISAIIDHKGKVSEKTLGIGLEGVLDETVKISPTTQASASFLWFGPFAIFVFALPIFLVIFWRENQLLKDRESAKNP